MSMHATSAAEMLKLRIDFESIREELLKPIYAERRQRPLAFWALRSDRGLPFALLDRRIEDLLSLSFEEITATPRIGQKKIRTLIKLLHRAAADEAPGYSDKFAHEVRQEQQVSFSRNGRFDASRVSELHWEQWRETVRRHQLEQETLGRLASTLRALPTVIWRAPLANYLNCSLADLRLLKTHGEKRVAVVLEVFLGIHTVLGNAGVNSRIALRLFPPFTRPLEEWLLQAAVRPEEVTDREIRQFVVLPLLNQIEADVGAAVHDLAAERLGVEIDPQSVRQQARRMGVTRARVYQMLELCSEVLNVRWPEGAAYLLLLSKRLEAARGATAASDLLLRTRTLFFPTPSAAPKVPELDLPVVEAVS